MRRAFVISALVVGFLAVGSGEAFAALRTFILVPGIPGDVTDENHPNWIEAVSMSQGATSTGKKGVACTDLAILKVLDRSGPALWVAAAAGQVFPEIRIEIVQSADTSVVVYDVRLSNAKVTGISTSGSSELPVESVIFSYQLLTLTFIPGTPQTIACQ